MLLDNLFYSGTCIDKKTKDAITEISIDDAIEVRSSHYLCWVRCLEIKPECFSGSLIYNDNICLGILKVPYRILLTYFVIAVQEALIISHPIDPAIVEIKVS